PENFPAAATDLEVGGNEMEGLLVRAGREHTLSLTRGEATRPLADILAQVFAEFRPSAHQDRLEFMDLLAVKECTDSRFLPPRYRPLSLEEVNARLQRLALQLG